jgi:hypothetical protein
MTFAVFRRTVKQDACPTEAKRRVGVYEVRSVRTQRPQCEAYRMVDLLWIRVRVRGLGGVCQASL